MPPHLRRRLSGHLTRWTGALAAALLLPGLLAVPGPSVASADHSDPGPSSRAAMAPRPLIWDRDFGDPSVVRDGARWYGAATGFRGRAARSDYDWGSWDRGGDVLNGRPTWAKYAGVWGPEVEQTPTGYVAYFTMPSRGLPHEQDRCIGVATAPDLSSTFTVLGNKPLVCPDYSATIPAFDQVPGRVGLPRRGVIDPSSYVAPDGRRFLLYRTQGTPSTIRIIRLNAGGTATFGRSRELIRDSGVLENPVMVEDRGWHYLITSRGDYGDCRYRTIWRRSPSLTKGWQGTRGHALLNRRNTGVCGPGGADYVPETDTAANRMFFHGWVCKGTNLPCYQSYQGHQDYEDVGKRALYAVRLRWTQAGPSIAAFVQGPVPPPPPVPTPTETPTPTPSPTPSPSPTPTPTPTGTVTPTPTGTSTPTPTPTGTSTPTTTPTAPTTTAAP
jgi:arabinan endo-1,5-alpha-L-arabinosidase